MVIIAKWLADPFMLTHCTFSGKIADKVLFINGKIKKKGIALTN